MSVSVSVISDKTIKSNKDLRAVDGGKAVRIKAVSGGKYLLSENGGAAPENITVKRVGRNLHVALEGTDPDQAELIIEGFFDHPGELVGQAEDGAYYAYVAVDGDTDSAAAFLLDGVSSPLALGFPALVGFGEGLVVAGGLLPAALAGLGALVGGAIIDHNRGGGGKVVHKPVPDNNGIDSIVDDKGPHKGVVDNGGLTDDNQPTLSGSGQRPGDKIVISDNGKVIGDAVVNEKGEWTFTPDAALPDGKHVFDVIVVNPEGNSSGPSDKVEIVIDTTPPGKPSIGSVDDNEGSITGPIDNGGSTDDRQPTLSGKGDAGDTVTIIDNGKVIGEVPVGKDGNWSFTPELPLDEGEHAFEVVITDPAGNSSESSDEYVVVIDLTPPAKPGADEAVLSDNEGQVTGPIVNGTVTDDNTPTFTGKSDEKNGTVVIYDGPNEIGRVPTDADGNWSFTPSPALKDGEHTLQYEVIDTAGNVGPKSDGIAFVVDTRDVAVKIEGADDNAGSVTGPISAGGVTDDTTPTVHGTATAGGTVKLYEGSTLLGSTVADANGKWSITPGTALGEGKHSLTATVTTVATGESKKSGAFDFEIDLTAPGKPTIEQVYDDVGSAQGTLSQGQSTDDTTPTLSGKAEKGSTVLIYDNGSLLGEAVADANGNWSFTPTTPLLNDTHSFEVKAKDKAGNLSEASDSFTIVVDTIPPAATAITTFIGKDSGLKGSDWVTNDGSAGRLVQGVVSSELAAGEVVQVSVDNGLTWVNAVMNGLNWAVQDSQAHSGDWDILARVVDAAGNESHATVKHVTLDQEVSPVTRMAWDGSLLQVDFVGSDFVAGELIVIDADGQRFTHVLSDADISSGHISVAGIGFTGGGPNHVVAKVVDIAGNISDGVELLKEVSRHTLENFNSVDRQLLPAGKVISLAGFDLVVVSGVTTGPYPQQIGINYNVGAPYRPTTAALELNGVIRLNLTGGSANILKFTVGDLTNSAVFIAKFFDENGVLVYSEQLSPQGGRAREISLELPYGKSFSSAVLSLSGDDYVWIDDIDFGRYEFSSAVAAGQVVEHLIEAPGFYVGSGMNDVFDLSDVDSVMSPRTSILGGDGSDTLRLKGAGKVLDPSVLQQRMQSVEVIDINGSGSNTLKVSLADVLQFGSKDHFISNGCVQLLVKGGADDRVSLTDVLTNGVDPGDWVKAGTVLLDGVSYDSYQHSGFAVQLLVQQGIAVDVVNLGNGADLTSLVAVDAAQVGVLIHSSQEVMNLESAGAESGAVDAHLAAAEQNELRADPDWFASESTANEPIYSAQPMYVPDMQLLLNDANSASTI